MTPEPIPTIADVAITILLIYGAFSLLVLATLAVTALYFWAAEKREERPCRRDRRVTRYAQQQTAIIDELFAIPHEGEWPAWPTDREAA